MKHLSKKITFRGAGKGSSEPEPATLRPPRLGLYEMFASYSVAEVLDLISDGPIDGLVNQNGTPLSNTKNLLQGVYFDNTPIEVTNSFTSIDAKDKIFEYNIANLLRPFFGVFYDFGNESIINYQHQDKNPDVGIGKAQSKIILSIKEYNIPQISTTKLNDLRYSRLSNSHQPTRNANTFSNDAAFKWVDQNNNSYFKENKNTSNLEVHFNNKTLLESQIFTTLIDEIQRASSDEKKHWREKQLALEALNNISNIRNKQFSINGSLYPGEETKEFAVLLRLGGINDPAVFNIGSSTNRSIFTQEYLDTKPKIGQEQLKSSKYIEKISLVFEEIPASLYKIQFVAVPKVNNQYDPVSFQPVPAHHTYTGEIYGFIVIYFNTEIITELNKENNPLFHYKINSHSISNSLNPFLSKKLNLVLKRGADLNNASNAQKFNFISVSCEFKNGTEFQTPFKYFKNVYVDYEYSKELYGPFKTSGQVQKIIANWDSNGASNPSLNVNLSQEGSSDYRSTVGRSFTAWNTDNSFDEEATPHVHTIENPNVSSVYFSLVINTLKDTREKDMYTEDTEKYNERKASEILPAIVQIEVEWGKVTNGNYIKSGIKRYAIMACVEGQMIIDFGQPDVINKYYETSVRNADNYAIPAKIYEGYNLPPISVEEDSSITKRYIKITKLSCETNSVLVKKNISVFKVTEIIPNDFSYPLSSIAAIKIDSRAISSIPERSYDCRLKKIKIPENYYPISSQTLEDNRYIKDGPFYKNLNKLNKNLIYEGDWNGNFKEGWTDNPAWILYDLLTSQRYGLGQYIDESQINIWELYKIGRFCDAVDDDGYFEGVDDGNGGLEPRYSCNILFKEKTKIYDAITTVANLFRGVVYFANSEIHFLDDRPRLPVAIFNNSNVKDGFFNYVNNRRDQQYNSAEIFFLDRNENFQVKTEIVEDQEDIRKRGIFKTSLNTVGVTSKAMARRIGKHLIYESIKENQGVEFYSGPEVLLCRPGDLIIIDDEMKTRDTNYGRILEVNDSEKSITIENNFDSTKYSEKITVYKPTGYKTNEELKDLAQQNRSRLAYFDITKPLINNNYNYFIDRYYFSGYSKYEEKDFAVYVNETGETNMIKKFAFYFGLGSGYVFATGVPFTNSFTYNKIITNTGISDIREILITSGIKGTGQNSLAWVFSENKENKYRNADASLSSYINDNFSLPNRNAYFFGGLLPEEIDQNHNVQIEKFDITGEQVLSYGHKLFLDKNNFKSNFISFIKEGSIYKIDRKNAEEQIYKVINIKEINQNEYSISAKKYNTGKFVEIEKFEAQDFLPNTYYGGQLTVGDTRINVLKEPKITYFNKLTETANGFTLKADWDSVESATSYEAIIYNELAQLTFTQNSSSKTFQVENLNILGNWNLKVKAVGNGGNILSSKYSYANKFITYEASGNLSRPTVIGFEVL